MGDEVVECHFALGLVVCLEGEHVAKRNAPMRAEPTVRDLTVVEQLDQRRPGYVEQVGRLLGGKLGFERIERNGITPRQLFEQRQNKARGDWRQRHRVVAVIIDLETQHSTRTEATGDLAARLARHQRLAFGGQHRGRVCGNLVHGAILA